jgi:hypothetical protein
MQIPNTFLDIKTSHQHSKAIKRITRPLVLANDIHLATLNVSVATFKGNGKSFSAIMQYLAVLQIECCNTYTVERLERASCLHRKITIFLTLTSNTSAIGQFHK